MWVGQQLVHLVLGRVVAAPNLRVAHEEQLLGGEAEPRHGLLGRGGAGVVGEARPVGCLQPTVISDVLPQRAPATND